MNIHFIFIIITLVCQAENSRTNTTDFYSSLLGYNLTYQTWSGYEDIDWYASSSTASVYYSLWECSQKTFADHSVPILFWIQGGPGKSSQFAAFTQIGPIAIEGTSKKYVVSENPWSWNYNSHLVFIDQPIGTGLSYNKGKGVGNTQTATQHFINFLSNFLKNTPWGLKSNPIYLAGQGYAGHFIPSFAEAIKNNGSLGLNLAGILLGGGYVDPYHQTNNFDSFLYSVGVASKKWRDITRSKQNQGIVSLKKINLGTYWDNYNFIISSQTSSQHYGGMNINNYKIYGNEDMSPYGSFINTYKSQLGVPSSVVFTEQNLLMFNAFKQDFGKSFSESLSKLISLNFKVLIYNGQNDFKVNTAGVLNYLQNLQWKGAKEWLRTEKESWVQSGKNYGWVKRYQNCIFAMLRNTGHHIYQQNSNSGKAAWLMLNNYFSNKW